MAISDYLMSRLALRQNARQTELALENEKRAREAQLQRSYIEGATAIGSSLANLGVTGYNIGNQIAADDAKNLQEMALADAATQGAQIENGSFVIKNPINSTAQPLNAASPGSASPGTINAQQQPQTFPMSQPQPDTGSDIVARRPESGPFVGIDDSLNTGMEPIEIRQFETGSEIKAAGTDTDKSSFAYRPQRPEPTTDAEFLKEAQQAILIAEKSGNANLKDIGKTIGRMLSEGRIKDAYTLAAMTGGLTTPMGGAPVAYTKSYGDALGQLGVKKLPVKELPPENLGLRPELPPEELGLRMQTLKQETPAYAPAPAPAPASADDPELSPSTKEMMQEAAESAKPMVDPVAVMQDAFIERVQAYKKPKFKGGDPMQLADKIIKDIEKERPMGNPLLNFITFGEANRKLEKTRQLARKLVAAEIIKTRVAATDKHFADFQQKVKLEAQVIGAKQKALNDERRAKIAESKLALKITNPQKAIEALKEFVESDQMIGDVVEAGKLMMSKGQSMPGGSQLVLKAAKALATAATPDQSRSAAAALNASLAGVGAGGNLNFGVGGQIIKEDLLKQAADAMMKANMTDEQRSFQSKMIMMIQRIGKAKEGGRMTDADLRFYLDNLVIQDNKDPASTLRSINYLKKVNARNSANQRAVIQSMFPNQVFNLQTPTEDGFSDADLALATRLGYQTIPGNVYNVKDPMSLTDAAKEGLGVLEAAKDALLGDDFDPDDPMAKGF